MSKDLEAWRLMEDIRRFVLENMDRFCTDVDGFEHDLSSYYVVSKSAGSLHRINAGDPTDEAGDPIEFLVTEVEHARIYTPGRDRRR